MAQRLASHCAFFCGAIVFVAVATPVRAAGSPSKPAQSQAAEATPSAIMIAQADLLPAPPVTTEEPSPTAEEAEDEKPRAEAAPPASPRPGAARSQASPPAADRAGGVRDRVAEDGRRLEELRRLRVLAEDRKKGLQVLIDRLMNSGDREQRRVANLQRALDDEKANADQLAAQIEAVKGSLQEAREAAGKGKDEREQLRWIVGGIAGLTLIGAAIVGFLLLRARRRARELSRTAGELQAEKERRSHAKDWALVSSGRRLKLSGSGLSDQLRGVVVGRSTEVADVLIEGSEISRRHARFHLEDDRLYVTDLDSMNGVVVNNKKIPANSPFELRSGDQISIATSAFEVRSVGGQD
jgi:hypothetical protein